MSDESVYHFASHYYTCEEIAERFNVSRNTVMALHGDAFNKGKDDAKNLPRFALQKVINDFLVDPNVNLAALPNTAVLLKAIELHARKYEGLGTKSEVVVKHEDRPSASDIRFVPLQAPDEN